MSPVEFPDDLDHIASRFAVAVANVGVVTREGEADTGSYTYRYVHINAILNVVKAALADQFLVVTQPIAVTDGILMVTTEIRCMYSGETLTFPGPGCPVKGDPQQAGSAITYFRRYALTSLFGIEAEDDDGALAHRAVARPGRRTEAEGLIRDMVADFDNATRDQFMADFRDEFNSTLTNLPESRHGDALTWARTWDANDTEGTPTS